eukprot:539664-Prorocentrum_minimum.AAC.3
MFIIVHFFYDPAPSDVLLTGDVSKHASVQRLRLLRSHQTAAAHLMRAGGRESHPSTVQANRVQAAAAAGGGNNLEVALADVDGARLEGHVARRHPVAETVIVPKLVQRATHSDLKSAEPIYIEDIKSQAEIVGGYGGGLRTMWRGTEGVCISYGGVRRGSVHHLEGCGGGLYTLWRGNRQPSFIHDERREPHAALPQVRDDLK